MNAIQNERIHAVVTGRVQGVGFRYFVQQNAIRLALTGWVRNQWDGSVELLAEGSHEALLQLLLAVSKGPPSAVVTNVDTDWLDASGEFQSFHVKFS